MGDAGVIAFDKIKKDIPQNIEVLKVGHHGGKNVVNKSMTDYLKNSISVISTGPNNFGHPNKITLDILRHTQIYRTDYNNSIKITTDGKIYKINTFNLIHLSYHYYIINFNLYFYKKFNIYSQPLQKIIT